MSMIYLESLAQIIAHNSLRASLLILCVVVLRALLRRRLPAYWLHLLWMLVAIRLFLPVVPATSWSVFNLFEAKTAASVQSEAAWQVRHEVVPTVEPVPVRRAAQSAAPAVPPAMAAVSLPWLPVLWLAGVVFQILVIAAAAWRMHRRLRGIAPVRDGWLAALARQCAAQAGLPGPPAIFETDAVSSPAVVGLWRPRLLLPRGLPDGLSEDELRFVLLHECIHLRRRDLAAMWLLTAARVLHWFNPLVWLAARLARTDAELACDEAVLRLGHAPCAYGETLLKLARGLSWQQPPLPSVGILEGKSAMRTRLTRIVSYAPPTLARTVAGASLLVVAAVAFGADEMKEAPPAVSEPGTVDTSSDFAKGWSVVRVAIPSTGNIGHAFVDMKSPAGRELTLSKGVVSKEGVSLEMLEWSGSPVRARLVLRKGHKHTELYADASLVARDNGLRRRGPLVDIKVRIIEMPNESVAKVFTLDDPMRAGGDAIVMVMAPGEADAMFGKLNTAKGVELLTSPTLVTESQQRAVIEPTQLFIHATAWNPPDAKNKHWTPTTRTTQHVGVTLDVEPTVHDDDTIGLALRPQVVEFLGFVDHVTRKSLAEAKHDPTAKGIDRWNIHYDVKKVKLSERYEPVFSKRRNDTEITIFSGHTVILRLHETGPTEPFASPSADKSLFAVFTARRLAPVDEVEPSPDATPVPAATPVDDGVAPYAQSVPNKPGFVTSPHVADAVHIDVRGLPPGKEVKCPYTGKMFRVP